jgi:hypothetical protein
MGSAVNRLRRSSPWVWLVGAVAAPAYAFFWEYVVNLPGKLLYLRSEYRGPTDAELRDRSLTCVQTVELATLADLLRAKIPGTLLESERQRLLAKKDEAEGFSADLFAALDNDTRAAILKFALSPAMLAYVIPYFRVVPRLRSPNILFNIVRSELSEEGSKLWHRDGWTYRSLTIFTCLSEVNDGAGPYFAIGTDQVPFHADVPKDAIDPTLSIWKRYRLNDDDVFRFVDRRKVAKLTGPPGSTILVDSGACYHKGGYCTTHDRLMLQIRYVTDDGDADLAGIDSWVAMTPELAALREDPICRHLCGSGNATLLRRFRLWRILKPLYRKILRYYLKPRTEGERLSASSSVSVH